jgi:hypothetical protein
MTDANGMRLVGTLGSDEDGDGLSSVVKADKQFIDSGIPSSSSPFLTQEQTEYVLSHSSLINNVNFDLSNGLLYGEVPTLGTTGLNENGSLSASLNSQVYNIGELTLKAQYTTPQDSLLAGIANLGRWTDALNSGWAEGQQDLVNNTSFLISHPIQTANELGYAIVHPDETFRIVGSSITSGLSDFGSTDPSTNGSARGHFLFDIASGIATGELFTASKGATVLSETSEQVLTHTDDVSRVGSYTDDAARLANETDLGADLSRNWYVEPKIQNQMKGKGWTQSDINDVLNNPAQIAKTQDTRNNPLINGRNNQPATVYYRSDGHYVVKNDITGEIIQVSKRSDSKWIDPFGNQIKPINKQ